MKLQTLSPEQNQELEITALMSRTIDALITISVHTGMPLKEVSECIESMAERRHANEMCGKKD